MGAGRSASMDDGGDASDGMAAHGTTAATAATTQLARRFAAPACSAPPRRCAWRGRVGRALSTALLLLLFVLGACGPRVMVAPTDAGRYAVQRDIPYAEGNPRFALDLYRPVDPPGVVAAPRPMLVFIHGGVWTVGEKDEPLSAAIPEDLAARGAVVVVPNYRLWPEAVFPDFMHDAAAAVAWAERNAAAHGADPEAIFLAGHSSGATMAMLLGLDRRYLDAAGASGSVPAGLVGISGIYKPWFFEHRIMRPIFGPRPDRAVILPASHLRPGMPPTLLLSGRWDFRAVPTNSIELAAAMRAAGGEAEVRLYDGIGHLDILLAGLWLPSLAPTADDIAAFVRDHHARIIARRTRAALQELAEAPHTAVQQRPGTGTGAP